MRIDANSIEQLIELSGDKKEGIILLDNLITSAAPNLERWLLKSDTYVMIGYGRYRYDDNFPPIALAPQKNYISLYVYGEKDGELFTTIYKSKLGKVTAGKSCINIKNVDKINQTELVNLVKDCIEWNNSGILDNN